jgi:hypothetical protein
MCNAFYPVLSRLGCCPGTGRPAPSPNQLAVVAGVHTGAWSQSGQTTLQLHMGQRRWPRGTPPRIDKPPRVFSEHVAIPRQALQLLRHVAHARSSMGTSAASAAGETFDGYSKPKLYSGCASAATNVIMSERPREMRDAGGGVTEIAILRRCTTQSLPATVRGRTRLAKRPRREPSTRPRPARAETSLRRGLSSPALGTLVCCSRSAYVLVWYS